MVKFSQKSILYKVKQEIAKNGLIISGDKVIVALSGGPDSICLLDILLKLKSSLNMEIMACHFNHKLRGEESDGDERFVRELCEQRGIKCFFGAAQEVSSLTSEEQAREARYNFFYRILNSNRGGKIAIAHHANDVAETLLLRLIRGTGLKGLKGIPSQRENFVRPLLSISRNEIMDYMASEHLEYRIDQTNTDIRYTRNYIREIIIPEIAKINPNIIETLCSTANTVDHDYDLINGLAERAYKSVVLKRSENKIVLDHHRWLKLHPSIQRTVLRLVVANLSTLVDVTNKQLNEAIELLTKGIGKKYRPLPHSLRVELKGGKIVIEKNCDQKTDN